MSSMYFDYAAATPMHEEVIAAMQPYFSKFFYNPSALYLAAQDVRRTVEQARSTVAQSLGVRPSEIVFTAGGTEANNLAIYGIMQRFSDARVVVSAIEHDSVIEPAKSYLNREVAVKGNGIIDLDDLQAKITDDTVLVSIGWVNNEIGTIQPLAKVREIINEVKNHRQAEGIDLPLYLHTDACQAGNYLSLKIQKIGVDMLTLNGGKVYGPKQSGALFVRAGIELDPQILGGGQENGLRSGTENIASIVGLAKSIELSQDSRKSNVAKMQTLQSQFIKSVTDKLPEVITNGSLNERIANNVHLTFPGKDNERLMMHLDELGVQCAVGSACSASKDEPSHVLTAIGKTEAEARSSLRFTMGRYTTKEAVNAVIRHLEVLAK